MQPESQVIVDTEEFREWVAQDELWSRCPLSERDRRRAGIAVGFTAPTFDSPVDLSEVAICILVDRVRGDRVDQSFETRAVRVESTQLRLGPELMPAKNLRQRPSVGQVTWAPSLVHSTWRSPLTGPFRYETKEGYTYFSISGRVVMRLPEQYAMFVEVLGDDAVKGQPILKMHQPTPVEKSTESTTPMYIFNPETETRALWMALAMSQMLTEACLVSQDSWAADLANSFDADWTLRDEGFPDPEAFLPCPVVRFDKPPVEVLHDKRWKSPDYFVEQLRQALERGYTVRAPQAATVTGVFRTADIRLQGVALRLEDGRQVVKTVPGTPLVSKDQSIPAGTPLFRMGPGGQGLSPNMTTAGVAQWVRLNMFEESAVYSDDKGTCWPLSLVESVAKSGAVQLDMRPARSMSTVNYGGYAILPAFTLPEPLPHDVRLEAGDWNLDLRKQKQNQNQKASKRSQRSASA